MGTTLLHITNGDSAAHVIKACSAEGDVLPWRDPMHHGPFPDALDLDALGNIRAEYLAGNAQDADVARLGFQLRNEHLRAASRYDEVVLWLEHEICAYCPCYSGRLAGMTSLPVGERARFFR